MQWIFLVTLTGAFYGIYNFFIKVASGSINQIVGAVILQIVAAVLGGLVLLYLKLTGGATLTVSSQGVKFAILAGIFVGLAEITSFYVFSKGTPASVGVPIIVGGTIVVGAILGLVFLKESLNVAQWIGLLLAITGVVLLSSQSN